MEDNKKEETEKTLTVAEQLEAVKTEKADLTTQLEEKTKGLKTAHDTLRRKDDELKRHTDIEGRFTSLEDQFKFLTGFLSETQGKTGEDFEQAKTNRSPDLLKSFLKITEDSKKTRQLETYKQENLSKINAIKERVEVLGLPEDDEAYWEIEDFATRGKFERAEAKLKKLENAKSEGKETPKETEEKIKERLEREILEKHGLLKPETGSPSASAKGWQGLSPDEKIRLGTSKMKI